MFQKLENPLSPTYTRLKEFLLSAEFPWYYNQSATPSDVDTGEYQDVPFYGHTFISRPKWLGMGDSYYPENRSLLTERFYPLLDEIVEHNKLNVNSFMRFNANCVHPTEDDRLSIPHNDHHFPHTNLIIYFTDAGGETVLFDNDTKTCYDPKEDDIVIFQGLHCMKPPSKKRRVVLVATYM